MISNFNETVEVVDGKIVYPWGLIRKLLLVKFGKIPKKKRVRKKKLKIIHNELMASISKDLDKWKK